MRQLTQHLTHRLRLFALFVPSLIAFSLSFAAPTLSGCGGALSGKQVDWPSYVTCAPGVNDIVGTVSAILLGDGTDSSIGDRGKRELNDLALKHGSDTVACLIERVVSDWTQPGLTQAPAVTAGAARGRAFLREVGTTARFEDGGGGGA